MSAFVTPLLAHRFWIAFVSGAAFLAILFVLRANPRSFEGTALVEAVVPSDPAPELSLPYKQKAALSPAARPGTWVIQVSAATREAAETSLEKIVTQLESRTTHLTQPDPEVPALRATLREKRRSLDRTSDQRTHTLGRISAIDAVMLALQTRLSTPPESPAVPPAPWVTNGPLGREIQRQRDVQSLLRQALPDDHPRLQHIRADLERLEQAAGAEDEWRGAATRVALFRGQLEDLQRRFPDSHGDIQRKKQELAQAEQFLQQFSAKSAAAPDLPFRPTANATSSRARIATEERILAVLEAEKARLQDQLEELDRLEQEIATLENDLAQRKAVHTRVQAYRSLGPATIYPMWNPAPTLLVSAVILSFAAGLLVAFITHRSARRIYSIGDISSTPGAATAVFAVNHMPTPRAVSGSVLRALVALGPWAIALCLFV